MTSQDAEVCAEKRAIWDYAGSVEVEIGKSAKDVWPYFFGTHKGVWSRSTYRTIAGLEGEVGELYGMPYPGGELFFEAVKLVPRRHLVLKITHKRSADTVSHLIGYDFISISEKGDGCVVMLQQAFTLDLEAEGDPAQESKKHDNFLAEIFQDLKKLAETDR